MGVARRTIYSFQLTLQHRIEIINITHYSSTRTCIRSNSNPRGAL
jgi:hypothetical protein